MEAFLRGGELAAHGGFYNRQSEEILDITVWLVGADSNTREGRAQLGIQATAREMFHVRSLG